MMSIENIVSERVCYVHCNFCNTILAVNVPGSNICAIVTVRCGHCANLLYVNVGATLQHLPPPHQDPKNNIEGGSKESGSTSRSSKYTALESTEFDQPKITHMRPPEKRQRVPSAYNKFIKEEIQRIKASNPQISHREAFSTAAKNWAHFPHIHIGLKLDGTKQTQLDHSITGERGTQKTRGFY